MSRLILIDATAYVFRAYHAMRPLNAPDGTPTGALFGFTRMLFNLVRERQEDPVVAVFDAPGPTFRKELYPDYKANRPPPPEDIRIQIPLCMEFASLMGIPVFSESGFEADDIIASLVRWGLESEFEQVWVYSSDKDLMQLVSDRVVLFDPMREKTYDRDAVFGKFSVTPEQMGDYLALVGDSSDNVPGVPGIGPRTASLLLKKHGSLESILQEASGLPGRTGESIRKHREVLLLSRQLVALREDVALDPDLMVRLHQRPFDREYMAHFLKKHGFTRLLREVDTLDLPAPEQRASDVSAEVATVPEFLTDPVDPEFFCSATTLWVLLDFEKPHPVSFRLKSLVLADEKGQTAIFDFSRDMFGGLDPDPVLQAIRPALENPACVKVVPDCKGLFWICQAAGIHLQGKLEDPLCGQYLLDSGVDTAELSAGSGSERERGMERLRVARELQERNRQGLSAEPVHTLYRNIELPLHRILSRMERTGVLVSTRALSDLRSEFGGEAIRLEQRLLELAGGPINIGSPKQLQKFLFEDLGLKPVRKTKTGFSTDADVLETLAGEHEAPELIVRHRFLMKLQNTYLDVLPKLVHPSTGRIHTRFMTRVAATGRLSSVEPNLQNIPVRTPEGRRIREAFTAPPGMVLLACDYSQIELRVLAHYCRDEALVEAFANRVDIHTRTASEVFGVPVEEVTSHMRAIAKEVNFGVLYGQTGFGLARTLGIPQSEARAIIERYFDRAPGILRTLDGFLGEAQRTGKVHTLFGRARSFMPDDNPRTRPAMERALRNFPIQGTAADILKSAMIRCADFIMREAPEIRMVLTVHDELVFEVPEPQVLEASGRIREIMEGAAELVVPLAVSVHWGSNWAEAK